MSRWLRPYRYALFLATALLLTGSWTGFLTLEPGWRLDGALVAAGLGIFAGFLMQWRVRLAAPLGGTYNIGNVALLALPFILDLKYFFVAVLAANLVDWFLTPNRQTREMMERQGINLAAVALGGAAAFWLWRLRVTDLTEPFYLSRHGLWFLLPSILSDLLGIVVVNFEVALRGAEPVLAVFRRDLRLDAFTLYITVALDAMVLLLYSHEGFLGLLPLGAVVSVMYLVYRLEGDLSRNRARIAEAEEQMYTDDLTRLHNVRYLRLTLGEWLKSGRQFAAMMLDLNSFKKINDTYGHLAGDEALRQVARVLRTCTRSGDVLCRYGGDEFCILLPEITAEAAEEIGRRIVTHARSEIVKWGDAEFPLLVSAGISLSSEGRTAEEIIRLADERLYQAKTAPGNVVAPARGAHAAGN